MLESNTLQNPGLLAEPEDFVPKLFVLRKFLEVRGGNIVRANLLIKKASDYSHQQRVKLIST
jgi:hypothetical protein